MELNGEIVRGDTTWADRTASRLLGARVVNGTRGKEKHSETSSFARRKAAKRATRGAAKLARGSQLCDKEERGESEKRMRGREGGGGSTLLSSCTRLNNILISISEK